MIDQIDGVATSRRRFLRAAAAAAGATATFGSRRRASADEPTKPAANAAGDAKTERNPELIERARKLMRESIVIDAYNCGAYSKHRHESIGWFNRRGPTQVDLVKAFDGELTAAGFDIADGVRAPIALTGGRDEVSAAILAKNPNWKDIPWPPDDGKPYAQTDYQRSALANALMGIERFHREIELASDRCLLCLKGSQIRDAKQQKKIGVIIHGNTSPMFEDSLELVHLWYRLGMRAMILARAGRNLICDGWTETRTNSKLTTFGVQVVKTMNKLGMLVDCSHMNDTGFYDVLDVSEQPVICSHSNSRALCAQPRNLTDEMVKALAAHGGVVGLTFPPHFIELGAPPQYLGYTPQSPLFQKWVDHCDHFLQLVGPDHIGIGSDFDGGGRLLEDMSQFPYVAEALLGRGYKEEVVRKILGENLLRVFEKVIT
jgi:membrane dipeptidase